MLKIVGEHFSVAILMGITLLPVYFLLDVLCNRYLIDVYYLPICISFYCCLCPLIVNFVVTSDCCYIEILLLQATYDISQNLDSQEMGTSHLFTAHFISLSSFRWLFQMVEFWHIYTLIPRSVIKTMDLILKYKICKTFYDAYSSNSKMFPTGSDKCFTHSKPTFLVL